MHKLCFSVLSWSSVSNYNFFFPQLWQIGKETCKVLKTVYVSETVFLRTLDMIRSLHLPTAQNVTTLVNISEFVILDCQMTVKFMEEQLAH